MKKKEREEKISYGILKSVPGKFYYSGLSINGVKPIKIELIIELSKVISWIFRNSH